MSANDVWSELGRGGDPYAFHVGGGSRDYSWLENTAEPWRSGPRALSRSGGPRRNGSGRRGGPAGRRRGGRQPRGPRGDAEERQRVQHVDLERQPEEQAGRGDGKRLPEHAADEHQIGASRNEEPDDARSVGARCRPDADLASGPGNAVADDAQDGGGELGGSRVSARWRYNVFVSGNHRSGRPRGRGFMSASAFRFGSVDVLARTVSDRVKCCEYGLRVHTVSSATMPLTSQGASSFLRPPYGTRLRRRRPSRGAGPSPR